MEQKIDYPKFLKDLDSRLEACYKEQSKYIHCKAECSFCCEKGDYPLSDIELEYLMQGFMKLAPDKKIQVQENFKNMEKGGKCPFLIGKLCSIYTYRPIICRTHGLAYIMKDGRANVPYCANEGKNYAEVYKNGELLTEPIKENLSTQNILSKFRHDYTVKNLYDWVNN